MFKKPKKIKNLRRGEISSVDGSDQDEVQEQIEKPSKPQKPTLLSFDDEDDDNEVFQVKKSSLSRRLKKEKKKKNQKSSETGKSSPSPSFSTQQNPLRNDIEIKSDDGLSIRLKQSSYYDGKSEIEQDTEDLTLEDEEENEDKFSSSHQFSKHSFRHGIIPDAAAIHAARKSRQRAREQGNQEFIALSNKKDEDEEEKQKQIFSEEEHDSAEEYENMLSLRADKTNKAEKFKSIEINDESDELENDDWESQQFRKVVGSAQLNSMNNLPYSIIPSSQNLFTKSREESPKLTTGQLLEQAYSNKRFENPPSNFIKEKEKAKSTGIRSPQDILNILKTKEKNIKDQHSKNFEELEDIAKEITDMKLEVDNADINKPLAMKNFTFYRDMKNFSDDLIDCLDEKFILLVDLEERAMNLLQKNSEKLIERRRQDIRDQFEEISEKGKRTFTDIPIDNEKRNRRSTEREGRRMRRRKMREKLNMFEVHYEGMSSDEEVPDIEINELNNNYAQIEDEVSKIFEDVCDEFCDLDLILQKFNEWKKRDIKTYKEAYIHLCLPKIVGIFSRIQSITWNPLIQGFALDKMAWYHPSMLHGVNPKETIANLRNDPDLYLVPMVIEKTILAKISQTIEKCWDPLSTSQTLKIVRLLLQLTDEFPSLRATSKNLQSTFHSITSKINEAIKEDIFIPLLHKNTDNQFYERQFHGAVKLFRNIMSFQGILSDKILKELAITSLYNKYLQQALNMYPIKDRITKMNLITSTLPKRQNFEIGDILNSHMKNLQSQFEMQS